MSAIDGRWATLFFLAIDIDIILFEFFFGHFDVALGALVDELFLVEGGGGGGHLSYKNILII